MIIDELVGTLMEDGCKIVTNQDELHSIITGLSDEEYDYVRERLEEAGYGLRYNSINDCYVIA